MKVDSLLTKYGPKGIEKGGELLLRFQDAIGFIDDCRKVGLAILRMNFWRETEQGVSQTPVWADLFEFEGQPNGVVESAEAATNILKQPMPYGETWVSFIVEDEVIRG